MTRRRSSTSITLSLIGSAALGGCNEEVVRRDDPARCERVRSGSHTGYYYLNAACMTY